MKLVVGLGNPGKKYRENRHNVGYMFLDFIIKQMEGEDLEEKSWKRSRKANALYLRKKIDGTTMELIKPQVFMNGSGRVVSYAVRKHRIDTEDIYVAHDDLDLKLNKFKIQKGRGPRLHNGVLSVEKELGADDFWRIRIGVDNRESGSKISGENYVLSDFEKEEKKVLFNLFRKIAESLRAALKQSR